MKLIDHIPAKYIELYKNFKSYKFKNEEVITTHLENKWPSKKQKNVFIWWQLKNGYGVGINKSLIGNITFPIKCLNRGTKYQKSNQKIKKKIQSYIRIGLYDIQEILNNIGDKKLIYSDHVVKMNSHRYHTFIKSGISCVNCGIESKFFALEKHFTERNTLIAHFNLYAIDDDGEEILMTKDHIIPKAKDGKNKISNYQTMCYKCNHKKRDKI